MRFFIFPKNSKKNVPCVGALFNKPWHPHTTHFRVKIPTHTRPIHFKFMIIILAKIYDYYFKLNTALDENICAC